VPVEWHRMLERLPGSPVVLPTVLNYELFCAMQSAHIALHGAS
jgi:hypothetical protein